MEFMWISEAKDLIVDGIVFLSEQSPFLGGLVVLMLFAALAARIADLDEIIRAWREKRAHRGEDEDQ